MNCPNCSAPQAALLAVGPRTNPYSLYVCGSCHAFIGWEDGKPKVISKPSYTGGFGGG